MKFGLLYITDYRPEVHGEATQYYEEILEEISFAEEMGFHGVFFAEHYIGGYAFPSPPVFLAAVAQRTKRIRLGTGVTLLPLSNPIRAAEEYAMVDVLSGGRLDFGVGRGVLNAEYDLFAIDESESQGRYREAFDIIQKAWTEPVVSYRGEFYQVDGVEALPKPVQRPHPPVWGACAVTPASFEWAGRLGLHPMTVPFAFAKHEPLQQLLDVYWKAHDEAGHSRDGREVLGVYHLYTDPDDGLAKRQAAPHYKAYWEFFEALEKKHSFESEDYEAYKKGLASIFGSTTYEELDAGDCMMFGNPEDLVGRLRRARERFGLTYPIFEVNFGGVPHAKAMESIELFAKEVMPHLQA